MVLHFDLWYLYRINSNTKEINLWLPNNCYAQLSLTFIIKPGKCWWNRYIIIQSLTASIIPKTISHIPQMKAGRAASCFHHKAPNYYKEVTSYSSGSTCLDTWTTIHQMCNPYALVYTSVAWSPLFTYWNSC